MLIYLFEKMLFRVWFWNMARCKIQSTCPRNRESVACTSFIRTRIIHLSSCIGIWMFSSQIGKQNSLFASFYYIKLFEVRGKYTYKSSGSETVGRDSLRSCVLSISSRTTQSGRTVTDASLCFNWLGRVKLDCLALCCCCHLRTCLWRSLKVRK